MDEDRQDKATELVVTDAQALAKRSASLVRRGLLNLSMGDMAKAVEIGKALASSLDFYEVLQTLRENAGALLPNGAWSLLLMDTDKQELYFDVVAGRADMLNKVRIKPGQGITGSVAQSGQAVVVPNVREDSRFLADVDGWMDTETESLVAVPLRVRGQCVGVIQILNYLGREGFSDTDLSMLQTIADFAAIALRNAHEMQRSHELTIIDERTGLYNARHLNFVLDTEIYRSQRYKYQFSLVVIGLQDLKNLAESMSYKLFDELIIQVAEALKGLLRLIDFPFRFSTGGDTEFYLLLPQTTKDDASVSARRVHKFFRETVWLKDAGLNVRLPASIAVANYPVDSSDKHGLLKCLDETLELAKNSGSNIAVKEGILA